MPALVIGVAFFLALLLLSARLWAISAATLHLRMTLTTHFLLLLMLAAAHAHLLLVMLRIHLLLAMHLLVHGILAVTSVSFVARPGLISLSTTFFAMLLTAHACSLALMVSDVARPVFSSALFAMFFTAHACSLALMVSDVPCPVLGSALFAMFFTTRSCSLALTLVPQFISSSSSSCGADFLSPSALARAFSLVERLDRFLVRFPLIRRSQEAFVFGCLLLTCKLL